MTGSLKQLTAAVLDRCDRLARHSEGPTPQLTRTFLSPAMRGVHRDVSEWMRAAGLGVRVDGIGNIVGRREALTAGAPALLVGSHLDTVSDAGKFDGSLGVLLGVALVETLGERALPFAVEVVGFSEEEGVRFGTPYLGSLGFTGQLTPAHLALRDRAGKTVAEAARAFGCEPAGLAFDARRYVGYLEAHIEQGPVLDAQAAPLGVVSAIVGQSRRRVRFTGRAAHAGTTPMGRRRDALAAAASWVARVEEIASTSGGVATVGQIAVAPGGSNVVPGEAVASLDVRHADDGARARLLADILGAGETTAGGRGVSFEVLDGSDHPSTEMDHLPLRAALGDDVPVLPSGAGHDAAILARVMPARMLFLRSPGGVSHHPDERVYAADVERALVAMVRFVEHLAGAQL